MDATHTTTETSTMTTRKPACHCGSTRTLAATRITARVTVYECAACEIARQPKRVAVATEKCCGCGRVVPVSDPGYHSESGYRQSCRNEAEGERAAGV